MTDTRDTRDLFCWYSSTCIPALPAPKPTPKATPRGRPLSKIPSVGISVTH